jgi:membrane-associated phospholipid phosphatase
MSFWQRILEWDVALFKKINSDWANPVFDAVLPLLRNQYHWAPLYIFIIVFALLNFRVKGLWWVVFFLMTVALCDMTGTRFFKYGVERIRPCNLAELADSLRLLVPCPGGYGFTSNHAANHFGMSVFFFITFRHLFKKWTWLIFIWPIMIGYAQIYVGVHFPGDIAGGAVLGVIYGSLTGWIFNKQFGKLIRAPKQELQT